MTFFEAADEVEQARHQPHVEPEWLRVPYEEVPQPLRLSAVLARGRDIAIVVSSFQVYSTGFLFVVRAVRDPRAPSHDHDLQADIGQFSHPQSAERFRLGLAYADGRAVTNDWPPFGVAPGEAPPASLRNMGGSGSADGVTMEFWAWPIPDQGDLDLVYAWPVRKIAEGRFTLSGELLREAAAAATPIWPAASTPDA
jgi:hypothetical protein